MRRAAFPLIVLGALLLLAALFTNNLAAHAYTDAQAQAGMAVFNGKCQGCHGATGEGRNGPKLANSPDLATKYSTAGGLYTKIKTTMPRNAPGTLTDEEAINATAYVMSLNGLRADGTALTTANAASVSLTATAAPAGQPTQMPRTGDALLPLGLAAAGITVIALGVGLRRRSA